MFPYRPDSDREAESSVPIMKELLNKCVMQGRSGLTMKHLLPDFSSELQINAAYCDLMCSCITAEAQES